MSATRIAILTTLLTAGICPSGHAAQDGDTSRTQKTSSVFFPREGIFPRMLADGTAHTMGLNRDLHSRRWLGSIGAQRPLFGWDPGGAITLQLGIGASIQTSIVKKPGLLEVLTVDFFVDVPVDIRFSPAFSLRTGYGHYSAHLADDGIEILGLQSVNYAKDYILLIGSCTLPALGGHLYGGGRIDYASLPERTRHWTGQVGLEAGNVPITAAVRLYAAIDIKVRSEVSGRTTQSYQLGFKFFERPEGMLRVAYTYRTGTDDRGQFYREETQLSLLGVFLDF